MTISMTALEIKVYKTIVKGVFNLSGYTVEEIAEIVGESKATVKGAVGSLTKKGLVSSYEHDVNGECCDVSLPEFPLNPEASGQWYLCDEYTGDEWEALVQANYVHLNI